MSAQARGSGYLKALIGFIVLLGMLSTGLSLPPEQEARAANGDLIIGFQSDAQNLDPRKARITPDLRVTTLIHSSLLRATSNGLVPDLAESWENPDLSTYIFHLRRDVTFHDGTPLTAEDVKFTYDSIRDPNFASPDLATFEIIENIEVPDPYTVVFRLSQPSVSILAEFNRGIVSKAYAEANPDAANLQPMGSGPYKFVEWVPNTFIRLEANPNYYGGEPHFQSITFNPISDDNVRSLRLEAGAIDVMWTSSPAEMNRLRANPALQVFELTGSTADFVQLNTCNAPLDDVRVRQAIVHGINLEELTEAVYFGGAEPGASPIVPSSAFHEQNLQSLPYDPERARELLAEAGYPDGLQLQLEQLAEATVNQYSQVLQEQLAEVGINLELVPREAATIIRDWTTNNYQMITFGLGNRYDPDTILYPRYHSTSQAPNGNNTCYANPEVDQLLDEARQEPDFEARRALYSQIQGIIVQEVPIIILTYKPEFLVAPTEIQNLSYDPYSLFYNFAIEGSWGNAQ